MAGVDEGMLPPRYGTRKTGPAAEILHPQQGTNEWDQDINTHCSIPSPGLTW